MGLKIWRAEKPANLALIKYMGKLGSDNRPSNPSLSYALTHLRTRVEVEEADQDRWEPLAAEGFERPTLSEAAADRFMRHFSFLKQRFEIPGEYAIRSANNFPSDAGLASSASSFAALTEATLALAVERGRNTDARSISIEDVARLSRLGSGSSCRSFFAPWAIWRELDIESVNLGWPKLLHQVVLLEKGRKKVSSSEAHRRVVTSELFKDRPRRAEERLGSLLAAFERRDWREIFEIVWADFWDMHSLFETSRPSFGYIQPESLRVMELARREWVKIDDGPLLTMDAGASVHLLWRPDQIRLAKQMESDLGEIGRLLQSPELESGNLC